jgi:hypothetical protein
MEAALNTNLSNSDMFEHTLNLLHLHHNELLTKDTILFRVNISGKDLWKLYLQTLEEVGGEAVKNHFNCSCCRTYVERFGNVVAINDDDGSLVPVAWVPGEENNPLSITHRRISELVGSTKISSKWVSKEHHIGSESTVGTNGTEWTHMSASIPNHLISETPGEDMSENAHQYFQMMNAETGVHRYSPEVFDVAINLFGNDELYRSEKFLAVAKFHKAVKNIILNEDRGKSRNLVWKLMASIPPGWVNVNSTMIGQLYGWIKDGLDFPDIKRMWSDRVGGDKYQRPVAAPSQQTIQQAEKLIEELGVVRSLDRRFARLEDIKTSWKPVEVPKKEEVTGGIFSHLKAKEASPVVDTSKYETYIKPITWEKFTEKVLPEAKSMKMLIPRTGNFSGILTATHEDAPPIIQWDTEENRHPVSSYVYVNGSPATRWNLNPNTYVNVTGIYDSPGSDEFWILVLEGCKDVGYQQGLMLFPEILKSEFHGIRSVIEAFSNAGKLTGQDEATACGYQINTRHFAVTLLVETENGSQRYFIDRKD